MDSTRPAPREPVPATRSARTTVPGQVPHIDVALLPALVEPATFEDRTVVVVDVLRATTTITTALSRGCQRVLPQPSIAAALEAHQTLEQSPATAGTSLIGGERGGRIVNGFHQGNSPNEYTSQIIDGKTLVLATTNGTVAMERCRQAREVLIGAMVNLQAVAERLKDLPDWAVLCSGTDGHITGEDVLFAGALVDRVLSRFPAEEAASRALTDAAQLALSHWRQTQQRIDSGSTTLAEYFRQCRGGINLARIGHHADIEFAANIDAVPVVPALDLASWEIRLP